MTQQELCEPLIKLAARHALNDPAYEEKLISTGFTMAEIEKARARLKEEGKIKFSDAVRIVKVILSIWDRINSYK
jgi:hypothetical protein